mgnify:CR=1 FL=1
MLQTFLGRIGDLFAGLLPLAEQPAGIDGPADPLAAREAVSPDREDRLPERDESFYWAYHTHW